MSWAAEELKTASLGDKRRNQRLIKIVEDLSAMPHASVTQAARDEAAVQGIYEFWGNVRVEPNQILAAHRDSTLSRVEEQEIVLAVQDTTELDFSSQPSKQGLGALSKKDVREQLTAVRWKRLSIAAAIGIVLVLAATTALDQWRKRDGWCVRFNPDGSQKTLYGTDCDLPK